MGVPATYGYADKAFWAYIEALKSRMATHSSAVCYTCTQGTFRAFRARLAPGDALQFANVLPATLRALFVADWNVTAQIAPWADRAALTAEVQALRQHHNFAPDTVIADVAWALRQVVEHDAFARVLAELPEEAGLFWAISDG